MSNEKAGENPARRKSKVSWGRFVLPGLVGPKPRPKGVGDGELVNILALLSGRLSNAVTQEDTGAAQWLCRRSQ
jgi:hypothetical protein